MRTWLCGLAFALAAGGACAQQSPDPYYSHTTQPAPLGTTYQNTTQSTGSNSAVSNNTLTKPVTSTVSVGGYVNNTYTQPAQGATGPVQGSQRGSSTTTTGGAVIIYTPK